VIHIIDHFNIGLYTITRLQSYTITQLHDYTITQLHDYTVTRLQSYTITHYTLKKMKLAIMQPYFMPYIGYFQAMAAVDTYVVYDDIQYIKGG